MDIHRCRFVPFQPSAINAVAFSHPSTRAALHFATSRLAVGRSNGDIEIWNPSNGCWHQELIIRGGKGRSVDGLVWVVDPDEDLGGGRTVVGRCRLFSIGYTSTLTEWDLEKGKPLRHASGQHGDIWCVAAQPAGPAEGPGAEFLPSSKLIAGTIDGELAIYSIEDNDLRFQRLLVKSPTKKAQMVSITFQSRKVVIVGCSDSTIRAYDMKRGHLLRRMTLGADLVGGAKDIIVWSVKCLPNGNIVSGDSTGQICIWDGRTYTQTQRIQSHKQDVLSLAISGDGTAIMSGGMDRRTFLYKQTTAGGQRWSKVWGRRYHDHDVKTMATLEYGRMSVVVSGGPDAKLMVVPLKEMGRENHRTMTSLPQQPPITSAPHARFMVSWWDRQVHIWLLRKPATELFDVNADGNDIDQNRKLLKSIVVKGESNITSASINKEGTLLFVSTVTDVKAFVLSHQNPTKPSDVTIHAIELPQRLSRLGASHIKLSPNGKWLCLIQEGSRVLVADVGSDLATQETPVLTCVPQRLRRLHRDVPRYITNGGLGRYDRSITHIDFSPDSEMLATADLAGYIDTWVLNQPQNGSSKGDAHDDDASSSGSDVSDDEGEATDGGERWIRNPNGKQIPKLPSAPAVLSFSDDSPEHMRGDGDKGSSGHILAAITSSWHVFAFDACQGSLTAWSRRHPRKELPAAVRDLLDLPKGILWQGSRMWIFGVSFLLMLDMSQELRSAADDAAGDALVAHSLKRKRTALTSGAGGLMERENLTPHKIRKHGENEQYQDMEVAKVVRDNESDSDEDLPDADGELSRLRQADGSSGAVEASGTTGQRKRWWITYKYRPILGVVPLNAPDQPLEVALVERPTWETEMPERYLAGHEAER
ncbi:hypothetical protein HIM_04628 [Hirsutella minnesotensis 3608]|uniref:Uncharacterized protein n=1 Tax=Hirsutella minnesotensis 3608 TaxID=1043627 RepID=A0A0F8A1G2_9HYPO|nr:hypothetical protein HIM_04628 [Hirsutella minnesotensis 3608]